MMSLRLLLLLLIALLPSAASASGSNAQSADAPPRPVSIQLQWRHQWQFAGFYAALAQGYYREAGLDVTLLEGGPDIDPLDAVLAGRADFGTAAADPLLLRYAAGEPIKLLASYFQRSPLVLVVHPDLVLPEQLNGKRIMMTPGLMDSVNFQMLLRRAGITPSALDTLPYEPGIDAFVRGDVDAMAAYRSNEVYQLYRRGVPFSIIDPAEYGVPVPDLNLFAAADTVRADPDTAAALVAATNRGWAHALDHPDELVRLIRARWNTQNKSAEHLRFEAHQTHSAVLPEVHPIGQPDRGSLTAVARLLVDAGRIDAPPDLDELLFTSGSPLDLTLAERTFLREHPRLSVRYVPVAPFVARTSAGPSGYSVELMERIARRAGFTLSWREAEVDRISEELRTGSADLVVNSIRTPERERYVLFSKQSYPVHLVIVVRRGRGDLGSLEALRGHRVASLGADAAGALLSRCCKDILRVPVSDFTEALHAVASGRADAAVMPRQVALHQLAAERLTDLAVAGELKPPGIKLPLEAHPFAVRRDLPALRSILDKAQASLDPAALMRLWTRWFGDNDSLTYLRPGPLLPLTETQRDWLSGRKRLRLVHAEMPPYAMTRNGHATGYTVGLMRNAAALLGLQVEFTSAPMEQALAAIQDGHADAVLNLMATPERQRWLRLGELSGNLEFRIFSRTGAPVLATLDDLSGRRLALWPDGAADALATGIEPPPVRVPVTDAEAALRAVASGDADAAVMEQTHARYVMAQKGIADVVEGPSSLAGGLPKQRASFFAVRADQAVLGEVLDAAVAAIPPAVLHRLHAEFLGGEAAAAATPPVALTQEERDFLDAHTDITFGADPDWAPLTYLDAQGEPAGIDHDTVEAINALLGTRIRLVVGDWSTLVEQALNHEIDGLTASLPQPERADRLAFSDPYTEMLHTVYVPAGNPLGIHGRADLAGRRVGYGAGVLVNKKYLAAIPGVEAVPISTGAGAINKLLAGDLDAVIGNEITGNFLAPEGGAPLTESAYTLDHKVRLVFSVRRDWPLLLSAIDKALAALPADRRELIRQHHLAAFPPLLPGQVRLSFVEREYLASKGNRLRYCFNQVWRPYDYLADGEHRGLFRDYLELFAHKLGVELVPVPSENWTQAQAFVRQRRCDLLSGAVRTDEREAYLDFTTPYFNLTHVLVAPSETPFVRGIAALRGEAIAVPESSAIESELRRRDPDLDLVPVVSPAAMREALAAGRVRAAVATLENAGRMVDDSAGGLHIIGQLENRYPISVATRSDEPLLHLVMEKAVAAVTAAERDAIEMKQTRFTIEQRTDLTLLLEVLGVAAVVALLLLYRQHELTRLNRDLVAARDAAQVAAAAKSQFLANMSHEMRTPMNAIMGMARLCLDTELDARQRGWLERLHGASRSLLGLINDVLDLSSIDAGGMVLKHAAFSLDEVLENLQGVAEVEARQAELLLWFDVDPAAPSRLVGDALRLEQVLLNLTFNAIKFTPRGEVCVRVEVVGATSADCRLRFSVTDTGIGIAPSQRAGLFQPFRQADASSTRRFQGSGLGLSISRELVGLMGGDIQVDSEPGLGSCFSFIIALQRTADGCPDWHLAPPDEPVAALICDAHAGRAAALARQIAAFGLAVEVVGNAHAALERLAPSSAGDAQARGARGWAVLLALRSAKASPLLQQSLSAAAAQQGVPVLRFAGDGESSALSLPASRARLYAQVRAGLHGTEPAEGATAAKALGAGAWPGLRVLLAEDNETNRTYVRSLLERAGCRVSTAVNGRAAVRRAVDEPCDVILMDVQMPELDGLAAARMIRKALGGRAPPIISLTAHALPDDRRRSLVAGMTAHLVKPVSPEALHAALCSALEVVPQAPTDRDPAPADTDRGRQWLRWPRARRTTESASADEVAMFGAADLSGAAGIRPMAVDFALGLSRAGGDARLYRRVLASFHAQHGKDPSALRAALGSADAQAAGRIVHGLKGVAGVIGAERLQRRATDAMTVLRDAGNWAEQAHAVLIELEAVLNLVDAALAAPSTASEPECESGGR
ncbi:MAG: transporter substrate-binding domain-containing protein [Thiohalocapsa sp.]|uniref:transporter substrate-binding domain-containing protein n=1 Tax=Thiohalocapsa sp. TaxID=2497641 RepID=UPI0025EFF964|nr:transporter substrate-binding domain-containing protein [Thiohalocapsa sp.]MCG6942852.1 transporter substrate-binding domain-containing protein [Thiohalocapsa sp.]